MSLNQIIHQVSKLLTVHARLCIHTALGLYYVYIVIVIIDDDAAADTSEETDYSDIPSNNKQVNDCPVLHTCTL